MVSKEEQIIQRLLALATKQQKVLIKLAQAQEDVEGNKNYLKLTWQTAGLNIGISEMTSPTVEYHPGGPSANGVTLGANYMVTGEVPALQRDKFLKAFKTQILSQKPELDGKVSTVFKDPSAPV